ncbi:hypothetical protein [Nocardia niwae]|uniref:hypothetical protein n=1 Tax=Nocardia niwae TaxID=626084 RepID=UPI0007A51065|nr:hypothetical protein [Nocardia niwae]
MTGKDIGIFLSARHFTGIASSDRKPNDVLDQVESAATTLMLAGGIAHRVVVADCAQPGERDIAEQFATESGFRVRHCPAIGPDQSTVLGTEILEALTTNSWLQTFVVGDDLQAQSAALDVLHRQRRWVIGLAGEYPITPRLADMTYTMPLARARLVSVVSAIITEIARADHEPTVVEVHRELQRRIAGFSPGAYGFEGTAELVAAAQETKSRPKAAPPRTRTVAPAKATKRSRKNTAKPDPMQAALRNAIRSLPTLSESELSVMEEVAVGSHLLELLAAQPDLLAPLAGGGMVTGVFADGVRQITGKTDWRPETVDNFFELQRRAADRHGGWILASPPDRPTFGVFLLADELPGGWSHYTPPSQSPGDDATEVTITTVEETPEEDESEYSSVPDIFDDLGSLAETLAESAPLHGSSGVYRLDRAALDRRSPSPEDHEPGAEAD